MSKTLFPKDSAVAQRQPKTDRLILARFLKHAAADKRLDENQLREAHAVLVKWADLESTGRLAKLNETQFQGDFLTEVFGTALGYAGVVDGIETWHRLQHHPIAGQTPDAVLGFFRQDETPKPLVVIELKGPSVHPDRDRSNGRTAVDQCWDYLVNTPAECRWGIVSNIVSFRLYERNSTKRAYEHFTLQSLRDFEQFKQFYVLFHRQGLIDQSLLGPPRAVALLKNSVERQGAVSDELYEAYSHNRTELISHLYFQLKHPLDEAIEMAQRLFDRIMFIAFCEDRQLLPEKTIPKAYTVAGFHAVTNPRWQNFKHLFRFIDSGNETHGIPKYNGGLFAPHAVDELELPDQPWTKFFQSISNYDFADEVNLDVLGHLFERSITELEKLKESGLFGGDAEKAQQYAAMPQSAKRKQLGIYYTPSELTSRIVQYTVEELIAQRFADLAIEFGISEQEARRGTAPEDSEYWRRCLNILRTLKIVDPACGSGAFLFQAYNVLELRYYEVIGHLEQAGDADAKKLADEVPQFILEGNLYGVDLSPEAVEITQLALWIRSATSGHTLAKLSENIVHGNSLVHDPEVHPAGFDWRERFADVFNREESGFDCVIGNPPWERIKQQKREFFSLVPEVILEPHPAKARALIDSFSEEKPELYRRWQESLRRSEELSKYLRKSDSYPQTAHGDINTYAVFTEHASSIVSPQGRVGLLVPSGIASDTTTRRLFSSIVEHKHLIRLYDFENKKVFFPEVHASFKFCVLVFGGANVEYDRADYVFFAHAIEDLEEKRRHIRLSAQDIRLFNPETRTSPIFRTRRDAELNRAIYERVPILVDKDRPTTGDPWGIRLRTMFHQSGDAKHFRNASELGDEGRELVNGHWVAEDGSRFLQVYEAKMVQAYDHRATSVETKTSNWLRHGQKAATSLVEHQSPEFRVMPRWWAAEEAVEATTSDDSGWFLSFKDVSSSTNQRTMIAAVLPRVGVTHHLPLIGTGSTPPRSLCLLANLNTFVYDFCARQKLGGTTFGFYHLRQLPTLPPDTFDKPCPWERDTTLEAWISERVLKLTCTAEDMLPLAEACDFTSGSFQSEYGGKLNKWDEAERAELMAELDAAFFHLYGIGRDDVEYILSTFKGIHDQRTLLPGHPSVAQRIVQKYAEMSFTG